MLIFCVDYLSPCRCCLIILHMNKHTDCNTRPCVCDSRVDYCNAVLAGSRTVRTDKLQGVMSLTLGSLMAACRGYCTTNSTGSMSPTEYNIKYKLAVLMYRCLHGTAPLYMTKSCTQTADVVSRQHLRSASQRKMIVPRYRLDSNYGRRCFAAAGPSTWNSLPDSQSS